MKDSRFRAMNRFPVHIDWFQQFLVKLVTVHQKCQVRFWGLQMLATKKQHSQWRRILGSANLGSFVRLQNKSSSGLPLWMQPQPLGVIQPYKTWYIYSGYTLEVTGKGLHSLRPSMEWWSGSWCRKIIRTPCPKLSTVSQWDKVYTKCIYINTSKYCMYNI